MIEQLGNIHCKVDKPIDEAYRWSLSITLLPQTSLSSSSRSLRPEPLTSPLVHGGWLIIRLSHLIIEFKTTQTGRLASDSPAEQISLAPASPDETHEDMSLTHAHNNGRQEGDFNIGKLSVYLGFIVPVYSTVQLNWPFVLPSQTRAGTWRFSLRD